MIVKTLGRFHIVLYIQTSMEVSGYRDPTVEKDSQKGFPQRLSKTLVTTFSCVGVLYHWNSIPTKTK